MSLVTSSNLSSVSDEILNGLFKIQKHIYIIGFMGSGKTTVGQRVSEQLMRKFVDTDKLIEEEENSTISDIFATKGEAYFRGLESHILRRLSLIDSEERRPLIVSTGGGIIENPDNIRNMHLSGKVVFLRGSFDSLYERISKEKGRPIVDRESAESLKKLYNLRLPLYIQAANLTVDIDGLEAETIAKYICNKII